MTHTDYEKYINRFWDGEDIKQEVIDEVFSELDRGNLKVVEKIDEKWIVNQWIKKAILLYFRCAQNKLMNGIFFDKVPLKTEGWTDDDFIKSGFRAVPGSVIRRSAYIAKNVVVMPSFINVGAYVNEGTMVDTHATIGSCAYIGKKCHISDGVTIAGVLEPLQSTPVIIEDNCFIGARSVVAEGVKVGEGSVLASGVTLTSSTPIIDKNGNVSYGEISPYSVVIPGSKKISENLSSACAVVIKTVDEKTRAKTEINNLLRL